MLPLVVSPWYGTLLALRVAFLATTLFPSFLVYEWDLVWILEKEWILVGIGTRTRMGSGDSWVFICWWMFFFSWFFFVWWLWCSEVFSCVCCDEMVSEIGFVLGFEMDMMVEAGRTLFICFWFCDQGYVGNLLLQFGEDKVMYWFVKKVITVHFQICANCCKC